MGRICRSECIEDWRQSTGVVRYHSDTIPIAMEFFDRYTNDIWEDGERAVGGTRSLMQGFNRLASRYRDRNVRSVGEKVTMTDPNQAECYGTVDRPIRLMDLYHRCRVLQRLARKRKTL